MTSVAALATTRRTTKAFDPTRHIPAETLTELLTLLRFAPSSVNSQPWHFVVAGTPTGKANIAKATHANTAYNAPKVLNASHVVVLCARTDLPQSHLDALLAQEEADGRFPTPEAKEGTRAARSGYVALHQEVFKDTQTWAEKQVYLALGALLIGAAKLGVDACPMEGFDRAKLNEVLGLTHKGLSAVVLVALGYSGADDFNAKLPKSRLPAEQVITSI